VLLEIVLVKKNLSRYHLNFWKRPFRE